MPKTLLSTNEIQFALPHEDAYGLKVIRKIYRKENGEEEARYQYGLPNAVIVTPLTADRKILAVEEAMPDGVRYLHLIGETMEDGETPRQAARRGLLEEAGCESKQFVALPTLLENTTRSERALHFFVALDCQKVQQPETGIAVRSYDILDFWDTMMAYYFKNPGRPHAGGNTLKALALLMPYLGVRPRF